MPYARNAFDGTQIYFEDQGGDGPALVAYAGLGQSISDLERWRLLRRLISGYRIRAILVDHRGHGRSEKPVTIESYSSFLKAADFSAVLDALQIESAYVLGYSWGARQGFSIGEKQAARVQGLILGGTGPFAYDLTGPRLSMVMDGLAEARHDGMEGYVGVIESRMGIEIPENVRSEMLRNSADALTAAWTAAVDEGAASTTFREWRIPCLLYVGDEDKDSFKAVQDAAHSMVNCRFIVLKGQDHLRAFAEADQLLEPIAEFMGFEKKG